MSAIGIGVSLKFRSHVGGFILKGVSEMITSKKDAAVIRSAINRLREGPSFLRIPIEAENSFELEASIRAQVQVWAKTWIVNELNALLPDKEKVNFNDPTVTK